MTNAAVIHTSTAQYTNGCDTDPNGEATFLDMRVTCPLCLALPLTQDDCDTLGLSPHGRPDGALWTLADARSL